MSRRIVLALVIVAASMIALVTFITQAEIRRNPPSETKFKVKKPLDRSSLELEEYKEQCFQARGSSRPMRLAVNTSNDAMSKINQAMDTIKDPNGCNCTAVQCPGGFPGPNWCQFLYGDVSDIYVAQGCSNLTPAENAALQCARAAAYNNFSYVLPYGARVALIVLGVIVALLGCVVVCYKAKVFK